MKLPAHAKAALFGATAVSYFSCALPALALTAALPGHGQRLLNRISSRHARFCLWFMGVKVRVEGELPRPGEGTLVVANHLSYLDVLAMGAVMPTSFVTSVEVRDTPFLGHIAKAAGCLFVERRSRDNLSEEVQDIARVLRQGGLVTIFPEGTSTDASGVLRFRRPLFQAAIDAGVRVQPLCLNYRSVSGELFNAKNRDTVCWYGDMDFGPHIWRLFQQDSVELEVNVLESIEPSTTPDPAQLAEAGHRVVSACYRPITA